MLQRDPSPNRGPRDVREFGYLRNGEEPFPVELDLREALDIRVDGRGDGVGDELVEGFVIHSNSNPKSYSSMKSSLFQ